MAKYHINDNGIASLCVAQGECPITKRSDGEHYNSKIEARKAYEDIMKTSVINRKKKKKKQTLYAPAKPVIVQPTLEEAEGLVERVKTQLSKNGRKSFPDVVNGNIIAYGLTGSSIYNLHHPESDRDITVITDSPKGQDFHHVFEEDDADVRIMSGFNFAEKVMEGTPPNVDLIVSGQLHMEKDNPYYSYFNSLRFNKLAYLDKIGRHARSDIRGAFKDKADKRSAKSLKTALRNIVLNERFLNDGNLRVEFTDSEREQFYKSYTELVEWSKKIKKNVDKYDSKELDKLVEKKMLSITQDNV